MCLEMLLWSNFHLHCQESISSAVADLSTHFTGIPVVQVSSIRIAAVVAWPTRNSQSSAESPGGPVPRGQLKKFSAVLLSAKWYALSHFCFSRTSFHLCVCFSKALLQESALVKHPFLCPLQENTPSGVCPSKTPSNTTDFPKYP